MKKRFLKIRKINAAAVGIFALCAAIYFFTAFAFIVTTENADTTLSDVRYSDKTGEFTLLTECEELSYYSLICFDFERGTVNAILFRTKETALDYGIEVDRYLRYTENGFSELVGSIGGIVIDGEICYNDENTKRMRIFGNSAFTLFKSGQETRSAIAYELLYALFDGGLEKSVFYTLTEHCKTDISYADYCRYFQDERRLSANITVTAG